MGDGIVSGHFDFSFCTLLLIVGRLPCLGVHIKAGWAKFNLNVEHLVEKHITCLFILLILARNAALQQGVAIEAKLAGKEKEFLLQKQINDLVNASGGTLSEGDLLFVGDFASPIVTALLSSCAVGVVLGVAGVLAIIRSRIAFAQA